MQRILMIALFGWFLPLSGWAGSAVLVQNTQPVALAQLNPARAEAPCHEHAGHAQPKPAASVGEAQLQADTPFASTMDLNAPAQIAKPSDKKGHCTQCSVTVLALLSAVQMLAEFTPNRNRFQLATSAPFASAEPSPAEKPPKS